VVADLRAGRILEGEKAGRFSDPAGGKSELVINLQTAKALDIDIPPRRCSPAPTKWSNSGVFCCGA
jgi:ABC-type uncharacterized transport system substrate-binding protein